jgi:hypothetical protein
LNFRCEAEILRKEEGTTTAANTTQEYRVDVQRKEPRDEIEKSLILKFLIQRKTEQKERKYENLVKGALYD